MSLDDLFSPMHTLHKVFVSYYHEDDQKYRNDFEEMFRHVFISKSVEPGEIDTDVGADYVKRLIQEDYITDTSVLVVLVGSNTYRRKHVDWEISAALNKKVGSYSGLMGILLPSFQLTAEGRYQHADIPPRLADNVKTKYAKVYRWDWVTAQDTRIREAIEEAFRDRINKAGLIDNSREQFNYNR